MLRLPPPPSSWPPPSPEQSSLTPFATPPPQLPTPPPRKLRTSLPLDKIVTRTSFDFKNPTTSPPLRQPHRRRTNPLIWIIAILCFMFSLILIFFGLATLIIFLVIKPQTPIFDTPNARLNAIYFDSPEYFNGDFLIIANFSNPNRKIDIRFEYVEIELFFSDRLISMQALQPFTMRRGETRSELVHMISSLVFLQQSKATELRRQVSSNMIVYNVRGSFKVRASLGLVHYSYWLYGRCQLQLTGPPTGILRARNCTTKK